ncbi:MAG: SDR family NAD(P)-dependent oxidoreductase [Anaerolineae bacterium]|nr:SDR family NAD(P)-dependent oxidoreductase [Anaerolineae bacterium]
MKDLNNKVAVVTGAASGVGRALAARCVREGMNVVLADIEAAALTETARELDAGGTDILVVRTDVSRADEVDTLARMTLDRFGAVHLLFNNAGVVKGGLLWEYSLSDWEWIINVNLWGVVHGVRTFVPLMLAQDVECHIVNTASIAGLIAPPNQGIYNVTKYGVVALTETLYRELAERDAKLKVSVLCPSHVRTRIYDAERNRPPVDHGGDAAGPMPQIALEAIWSEVAERYKDYGGMVSPEYIADCTFEAIGEERFYILTHHELNPLVLERTEAMIHGRNPLLFSA